MSEADGVGRTVLVTDAGRGSAISVIRSLGKRGWRVIAADSAADSPGFRSRYVSRRVRHPHARRDPSAVVNAIEAVARAEGVDLIVPVTDELAMPLSDARERFDGLARLALPSAEALARSRDKLATVRLAERLAIGVPRTRIVDGPDVLPDDVADLGWPVVVKPRFSRRTDEDGHTRAFQVRYAKDLDSLRSLLEEAAARGGGENLLQAYAVGEGHGVELLVDDGRPVAAFQHRRLREVPPNGGASSFRESVRLDPTAYWHAVALLGELRWTGLAMVEFKYTEAGPLLMEINGRIWGSLPLALKAGVDFPALMAALFMGDPIPTSDALDTTYASGVRARNLSLDVAWIGNVLLQRGPDALPLPPRRAALGAAFSLCGGDGFDTLESGDVGPALAEIGRIAGRLPHKLLGRQAR